MIAIQKRYGAVFDFDPLEQIPLEKAKLQMLESLEDGLVSGQRPEKVPTAIVAIVIVKGRAQAAAPLFPVSFAFGHPQRITDEMDELHGWKKLQRHQIGGF